MKKILYISDEKHYRPEDLKCLMENYKTVTYPPSSAQESFDDITNVIQACDPSNWRRYGTMWHIGYLDECSDKIEYFNMVDEILTSSKNVYNYVKTNYSGPCRYLPHVVDHLIYQKEHKCQKISEILGTFSFLSSSNSKESGDLLINVINAFWKEFDPTEPVSLILKSDSITNDLLLKIKQSLNLYDVDAYKKFLIVDTNMALNQELPLFNLIDCYINLNKNWSDEIIHTIGFNKSLITVNNSLITCESYADKYLNDVSITSIAKAMRKAYNDKFYFNIPNNLEDFSKDNFIGCLDGIL